jgi:glycosyltransferase involved in cell wall biosynthesis
MNVALVLRAVFPVSCWLVALAWAAQAIAALRGMPRVPDLTQMDEGTLAKSNAADGSDGPVPDLTVVVPACNEEESIEATLRSLLGSKGLRLQIIAVNDRSTDETGARMDAVAAEARTANGPHTLEVIHNSALPAGWMGKPHALQLAAKRARAPWFLFTDGDVRFDERALALALQYALKEQTDHVVLNLTMDRMGWAENAVLTSILALSQWSNRMWKVSDPKTRDFFGQGGFNLIRREVFEKLGGFEPLRMEVVEDLRMGWRIKRAGYRQRIVVGDGLARINWMKGPLGIVGLLEKNAFAVLRYRTGLTLLALAGAAVQIVLPVAALAAGGWTAVAGGLIYLSIAANFAAYKQQPWLAVFYAPAIAIFTFALARSMVLALWRDGVVWRGTHYKLNELREAAERGW